MAMSPDQDFVLKTIKSRDVHFVRFWFCDVLGNMKSFAVIPSELENAFEEGMGFDASCVQGFSLNYESDMLAFPDATTFQILPWRPAENAVARMFCSIRTPEGRIYDGDSRAVLAKVVARAEQLGYMMNVGPEIEYYYFKDREGLEVLDTGGYFDLTSLDNASDLRRDTILTLEKLGIPVEYSHHENGPSQQEIDLRFADAFTMADNVMTYKLTVKEIAMKYGHYASFMPKPMADQPGSGMHIHQSLFDENGNNVFFDENVTQLNLYNMKLRESSSRMKLFCLNINHSAWSERLHVTIKYDLSFARYYGPNLCAPKMTLVGQLFPWLYDKFFCHGFLVIFINTRIDNSIFAPPSLFIHGACICSLLYQRLKLRRMLFRRNQDTIRCSYHNCV